MSLFKKSFEAYREFFTLQTLEKIKIDQLQKYNKALEAEKSSVETNPRVIFYKAIENCKPLMGLAVVKKGGKNYQVRQLFIIEGSVRYHHV